jgi:hypothetical protein
LAASLFCKAQVTIHAESKATYTDGTAVGVRETAVAHDLDDTTIYNEGRESSAFKAHLGASVLFPMRLGNAEELVFAVIDCITNPYTDTEVFRLDSGIACR